MTDPDILDCKIHELQEEQRVAWRQLADSSLTTFERREVRNQIRLSNNELRQYLQMMAERVRFRVRPAEEVASRFGKPDFRLLALVEPPGQPSNEGRDFLPEGCLRLARTLIAPKPDRIKRRLYGHYRRFYTTKEVEAARCQTPARQLDISTIAPSFKHGMNYRKRRHQDQAEISVQASFLKSKYRETLLPSHSYFK
jgi:hypothetical protein